jgi:hypothetical protein
MPYSSWDVNLYLCLLSLGLPQDLVLKVIEESKKTHIAYLETLISAVSSGISSRRVGVDLVDTRGNGIELKGVKSFIRVATTKRSRKKKKKKPLLQGEQ